LGVRPEAYALTEAGIVSLVEGLKYMNTGDCGFLTLNITHEWIEAPWEFVTSIKDSEYSLAT